MDVLLVGLLGAFTVILRNMLTLRTPAGDGVGCTDRSLSGPAHLPFCTGAASSDGSRMKTAIELARLLDYRRPEGHGAGPSWPAPRWIRLFMVCATRGGDGWLWHTLGAFVLAFGGPERFVGPVAAASAVAVEDRPVNAAERHLFSSACICVHLRPICVWHGL